MKKLINKITGADDAAKAQQEAAQQGIDLQKQMFDVVQGNLAPFLDFGKSMLPMLPGLMQPTDRTGMLSEYYKGPEYAMASDQARRAALSSAEATGGLGSSTTDINLGSIAPMLGQNYLAQREAEKADLFNRIFAGAGMGSNAAAGIGTAAQNYGSQAAQLMQQKGAAKAGAAMAPFQTIMQGAGMFAGAGGIPGIKSLF
ncbi:MAG: DNA transfer protein [Plesiomonas shigelloides]